MKKSDHEKEVLAKMVEIYCRGNKHGGYPCQECRELIEYAHHRIGLCPFGENKSFCSECRIHCFKDEKRALVKKVMRYSGPRMIFYYPLTTIRHMLKINK